jgi:hypothetical protein
MASILRVNTLTDASSNNSVPMATVNQGTAKSWADFTMASTPSANDSFNLASITDVATGKAGLVVTSVFANTNYSVQGNSNGTANDDFNSTVGLGLKCNFNVSTSTSTYEFSIYAGSYVDAIHNYSNAHGDLA